MRCQFTKLNARGRRRGRKPTAGDECVQDRVQPRGAVWPCGIPIPGDVVARLQMNGISEPGNFNAQFGPVAAAQEKGQCLDVTCIVYTMQMDVR